MKQMLKGNLNRIYIFGDVFAFFLSAVLSLICRFGFDYSQIKMERYLAVFTLLSVAVIFLMYSYNLYKKEFKSYLPQVPVIAKAIFYSVLLFFLFTFFDHSTEYSRLAVSYYVFFSFIFLLGIRRISFGYILNLYSRGIGLKRVICLGLDEKMNDLVNYLFEHKELGYQIAGVMNELLDYREHKNLPVDLIGCVDDFEQIIPRLNVQTVFISLNDKKRVNEIINYCTERGYEILLVPDIMDLTIPSVQITNFAMIPLICFKETPLRGNQGKIKRVMDIILSFCGLIVLSPLFLVIAFLIKLEDKGSVFFQQERMGKNGQKILIWKFRTMVANADKLLEELLEQNPELRQEYKANLKLKDDPRVTRCGKFLRKFSLDELPQLFNVFLGEMSLVGPRPYLEREFASELKNCAEFKYHILLVPPGITGLWQVSGRSNVSPEERVRLDVYYINNWNLWLDIFLLLKTIPAVLSRKGAY